MSKLSTAEDTLPNQLTLEEKPKGNDFSAPYDTTQKPKVQKCKLNSKTRGSSRLVWNTHYQG